MPSLDYINSREKETGTDMQDVAAWALILVFMAAMATVIILSSRGMKRVRIKVGPFEISSVGNGKLDPLPNRLTFSEWKKARLDTLNNELPQQYESLGEILEPGQMVLGTHESHEWIVKQLIGYSDGEYMGLRILIWHSECVNVVNCRDPRLKGAERWGYNRRKGNGQNV